jgi:hypothetical protein
LTWFCRSSHVNAAFTGFKTRGVWQEPPAVFLRLYGGCYVGIDVVVRIGAGTVDVSLSTFQPGTKVGIFIDVTDPRPRIFALKTAIRYL